MTHVLQHCDQPALDAIYKRELHECVVNLLMQSTVSIEEFLAGTEGAYMLDVIEALRCSQENENALVASGADRVLRAILESGSGPQFSNNGMASVVPEPHPLDFDWRFVEPSFRSLEAEICSHPHRRIGIFGAPTLFLFLNGRGYDVTLYDKNDQLVRSLSDRGHLKVFKRDFFDAEEFSESYDIVMADPPWYLPHYVAFVRAGQAVLPVGGLLLLSVLPRLTRPGAPVDRHRIISDAFLAGLDLVDVKGSALLYDSPPFEKKALAVEGVGSGPWRRGDIFVFRKAMRMCQLGFPERIPDEASWNGYVIGRTVVRVKHTGVDGGEFSIGPASESGDLHFHSVSRRSPTRSRIDLWTSRDLALSLTRPDCAQNLLERLERGDAADRAIQEVCLRFNLGPTSREDLQRLVNLLRTDAEFEENGK